MKKTKLLFLLLCICIVTAYSQTEIQSFVYTSETRDTVIDFPTNDNNEYEKILMLYSMRCKDGLVSTSAERNKGCGEWDYSCNTYITDSTRVDSNKQVHSSHIISNFEGDDYEYSNSPTYTYFQLTQQEVDYAGTFSEIESTVHAGDEDIPWPISNQGEERHQILHTADELLTAGVTSAPITGLKLFLDGGTWGYEHMRIRMKNSSQTELDPTQIENDEFTEVYYLNTGFGAGEYFFKFHNIFEWDAASSILIDISYTKTGNESSFLKGEDIGNVQMMSSSDDDLAIEFTGSEELEFNDSIPAISNEVTIAFWAKGSNLLPQPTTIFESVDDEDLRSINIHLPWSNGSVFFDCGNVGNSYDRISIAVDPADFKNKWSHWAFTKNAITGDMNIYLNGNLIRTGGDRTIPIDIHKFLIGTSFSKTNKYLGLLDEFQIWNKELDPITIKQWMNRDITNLHPEYENLIAYYQFNQAGNVAVADQSSEQNDVAINGQPQFRSWKNKELVRNFQTSTVVPNIKIVQGDYNMTVTEVAVMDSLINAPNQITEYIVSNNDLMESTTSYLYLAGAVPVYDEDFNVVNIIEIDADGIIQITDLDYYSKSPASFEIMSFVTPYGIGLDFGMEGKTWTFDVTDFGPILNGKKRIHMSRGGQWQEDIDIKFVFIPGTPIRDVVDINQIWPVTKEANVRIVDNTRFEPRVINPLPEATQFKVRAAITGHGQEGEFIPRNHYVEAVGDGTRNLAWSVWTECADNAIYPQGGTWVYDRAGWCPGTATDVATLPLDGIVPPGQSIEIDYGMGDASGASNYIVNVQMVSYGDYNFSNDVAITDILRPSKKVEHLRFNTICGSPQIEIQNTGGETMSSALIEYGMDGDYSYSKNWQGNLAPTEKETVFLNPMNMGNLLSPEGVFNVRVSQPNGSADENTGNNEMETGINVVTQYEEDVVIRLKTNGVPQETSYKVLDINGNVIFERNGANLNGNSVYRDTLHNLNGCYRLQVDDSGEDGLSWWANNDGNGQIQIKEAGGSYTTLEPDFGMFTRFEFTAGSPLPTKEQQSFQFIDVYPNPARDIFNVELEGFFGEVNLQVINQVGQIIHSIDLNNLSGENFTHPINLKNVNDGMYYLIINDGNQFSIKKLMKFNF